MDMNHLQNLTEDTFRRWSINDGEAFHIQLEPIDNSNSILVSVYDNDDYGALNSVTAFNMGELDACAIYLAGWVDGQSDGYWDGYDDGCDYGYDKASQENSLTPD